MKAVVNAAVAAGFAAIPTVSVGGVRVNKHEYEADQQKPAAERQWKGKRDKEPEQSTAAAGAVEPATGPALAAPSAPHFGEPGEEARIDPLKNAVAPDTASPNQMLVMKKGKKYIVVDGQGAPITDKQPQIDPAGYDTEELAWQAVRSVPH